MSKRLDQVIKEMNGYGTPQSRCGCNGSGETQAMPSRVKAYRLNDVLRSRISQEEEEDMVAGGDEKMPSDDVSMEIDDFEREGDIDEFGDTTDELRQFFIDNPSPSDEEIADYANSHQMDMNDMRQAVYELIQNLLDEVEGDDYNEEDPDMNSTDDFEMDFSVGDEDTYPEECEQRM